MPTKKITPMPRAIAFAMFSVMLVSGAALADDYQLRTIRVSNPFVRATPPGAKVAGAFMTIKNQGTATDRLVSASSPVAGLVEIHEMAMEGGMMKMRALKGIDLKPGATVELQPGGYHVMLMDLKEPLPKDSTVPLTLTFKDAKGVESKLELKVPVLAAAPAGASQPMHMDHGQHGMPAAKP